MKSLLISAIFLIYSLQPALAQRISVSVGDAPSGGPDTVFALKNGELTVSANQIQLNGKEFYNPHSLSASPNGYKVSILMKESDFKYKLFDSNGTSYFDKSLEFFSLQDETAKNYLFDDGSGVLRDNVANFSFYSSTGEQLFSVSNSSQSTSGERPSELVSDEHGKTIVLYNPVINYGGSTGSRASVVSKERKLSTFFRDREREISSVEVNPSGKFISLILKPAPGSENYSVLIYDRFGNSLFDMETNEALIGAEVSENANYVTIYSSGRMQVYQIGNGERVGSASSRNSIVHAIYDSEENMIVALGGNFSGYRLTDPSVTVVNIGKRQIESTEIDSPLYALNENTIRLIKSGAQEYIVENLDRSVRINTSF